MKLSLFKVNELCLELLKFNGASYGNNDRLFLRFNKLILRLFDSVRVEKFGKKWDFGPDTLSELLLFKVGRGLIYEAPVLLLVDILLEFKIGD